MVINYTKSYSSGNLILSKSHSYHLQNISIALSCPQQGKRLLMSADETEKCGDGSVHGEPCAKRDNNILKIIRGKRINRNAKNISKEIN